MLQREQRRRNWQGGHAPHTPLLPGADMKLLAWAAAPHEVISASEAWCNATGFTEADIQARHLLPSLLQGPGSAETEASRLMHALQHLEPTDDLRLVAATKDKPPFNYSGTVEPVSDTQKMAQCIMATLSDPDAVASAFAAMPAARGASPASLAAAPSAAASSAAAFFAALTAGAPAASPPLEPPQPFALPMAEQTPTQAEAMSAHAYGEDEFWSSLKSSPTSLDPAHAAISGWDASSAVAAE